MFFVRSAAAAMKISGDAMISVPAEWCSPIHASSKPISSRCSMSRRSRWIAAVGFTPAGWKGARKVPKRSLLTGAPVVADGLRLDGKPRQAPFATSW